jgi:uncharacterized NAD-dependent epimerase/dehydratase family protein
MDGTALVLCEGRFSSDDGKTAHGLVRHTDRYEIIGVIDSTLAGRDAGEVLDGASNGIPIVASLADGIALAETKPTHLVIGLATDGGVIPPEFRELIIDALREGINVDCGMHEFLTDDAELVKLAELYKAKIWDIRKPPPRSELHFFSGEIQNVRAKRIAVLGTDCALGKRTTTVILVNALKSLGHSTEMIGTGQTAQLQGVRYGILLDSLVNDFVGGELEHAIVEADKNESPEFMVIEGQACLTHPGGSGGFEILGSARPHGVILQHAPIRKTYSGYDDFPIAPPEAHIQTIEGLFGSRVIAMGLNPEGYAREEIPKIAAELEDRHGIPCCDPLTQGSQKLTDAVLAL